MGSQGGGGDLPGREWSSLGILAPREHRSNSFENVRQVMPSLCSSLYWLPVSRIKAQVPRMPCTALCDPTLPPPTPSLPVTHAATLVTSLSLLRPDQAPRVYR